MEEANKCEVCGKNAPHQCSICQAAFYCCQAHQKEHWKEHKKDCNPFKICKNDELGYHVVATRKISEGETIFKEMPLIWGPKPGTGDVCLSCLTFIDWAYEDDLCICAVCGWILCCKECMCDPRHLPECFYISRRKLDVSRGEFKYSISFYDAVMVLRCLYQKKAFPIIWRKLMKLSCGGEEIKKTRQYNIAKQQLIKIIHNSLGLKDEFSEEEIMKVWGITMVNQRPISATHGHALVIYELTSLLENSCRANCYQIWTNSGIFRIIAGVPIKKGEHLRICYVYLMLTTPQRQRFLQQTKFIECRCVRCTDVTEFGTNISSYKCHQKNCEGVLLPESFLVKESKWACNKCNVKTLSSSAEKIFKHIEQDFNKTGGDLKALKTFIEKHKKFLPENSGYMFRANVPLMALIGQNCSITEISNDELLLKKNFFQNALMLFSILAPAEKVCTNEFLAHYISALQEIRRRLDFGESLDFDPTAITKELEECFEEFKKHVKYEKRPKEKTD